jgi:hypothetical protein
MRKLLIVVVLMLCSMAVLPAQKRAFGKFDLELSIINIPVLAPNVPYHKNQINPLGFYIEGRWQFNKLPVDLGFHIGMNSVTRLPNDGSASYGDTVLSILAVSDYQFGRGTKWNPYVGLGIGVAAEHIKQPYAAVMPRVGIRCFKFMNISVGYLATGGYDSRLVTSIGFYF